ncbi:MAG: hypothetical protein K0R51_356 [Cytophagaceae bacterium]|jgi:uncharacterized protein YbaP (TraB family)|nr:hypothetical protein [Cytophagaceae bacterium]
MIVRLLSLCFLFLGKSLSFAQAENTSVLYEISGGGLTHTSYVFGTIHLRDKRVFEQVHDKKDSLWHCFKRCDIIAGELKFDKKEIKEAAMDKVMLPDGVSLQSLLSPGDYEKVKAYAKETLGWKAILIDRIKPLFTVSLFTEAMENADYKYPLDVYLQEQGEKKKKEIAGIETIDEQMQALSAMSLAEQAKELVEFVNHPVDSKAEMEKMITLYRERRLLDLYELITTSGMSDSVEAALLTDRNKLMAYRIESMMLRKPVFAAIGSAHLPGDKGVLELLRKKGYKVRAVGK